MLVINPRLSYQVYWRGCQGVITGSLTTLAGLLAALKAQTVLASSLPFELPSTGKPISRVSLVDLAEEAGLLRSAFVVRISVGLLPEECFDFLSAQLQLQIWKHSPVGRNEYAQVFLLGNPYRTAIYAELLSHKGEKHQYYLRSRVNEITVAGAIKLIEGD